MRDARALTRELGGEFRGGYGVAPCPVCQIERRRDQRALWIRPTGPLRCFRGCPPETVLKAIGGEPVAKPEPPETVKARKRREVEKRKGGLELSSRLAADCRSGRHPYLARKGFPLATMPVTAPADVLRISGGRWRPFRDEAADGEPLLVVPLAVRGKVVSAQLITPSGDKRFIPGSSPHGAYYVIGDRGRTILCEGLATGLSIYRAAGRIGKDVRVLCCMSASGIEAVARDMPRRALIMADNDEGGTGAKYARRTGLRWTMPPAVGEDFNDFEMRDNSAADQVLRGFLGLQSARQKYV